MEVLEKAVESLSFTTDAAVIGYLAAVYSSAGGRSAEQGRPARPGWAAEARADTFQVFENGEWVRYIATTEIRGDRIGVQIAKVWEIGGRNERFWVPVEAFWNCTVTFSEGVRL